MLFDSEKCRDSILEKGYYVFTQDIKELDKIQNSAKIFCDKNPWFSNKSGDKYNRGKIGRANISKIKDKNLVSLVYNKQYIDFFNKYFQVNCSGIVSVSYEYIEVKHKYIKEYSKNLKFLDRNGWLHFDRSQSLKPLVYLKDVGEHDGPFTLVEKSHILGRELREKSSLLPYAQIKNRIDIDYPEIKYTKKPILGKAGTTIIFDTDIFHEGGNISNSDGERLVIRSQWDVRI